MGAQIAAHVANAGVPALLLDLDAGVAREGLKRIRKLETRSVLHTRRGRSLITTGGFDTDLESSGRRRLDRRSRRRADGREACAARASGRRPAAWHDRRRRTRRAFRSARWPKGAAMTFRRHWLGTHFFNPPRYLRLLEIIPTPETDPAVVERMSRVCRSSARQGRRRRQGHAELHRQSHRRLRRRVGAARAANPASITIEEIDAITGPAIGRPKAPRFRTMDIAGIDVLAHVAKNINLELPPVVAALVERGWIGEKSGQGFYKRQQTASGTEILTLDPATMTYRPRQSAAPACARRGAVDPKIPASASRRSSTALTRSVHSCARRSRPRSATRRRSGPTSPTRSTTSTASCSGDSAGRSGRSRSWTRSARTTRSATCFHRAAPVSATTACRPPRRTCRF